MCLFGTCHKSALLCRRQASAGNGRHCNGCPAAWILEEVHSVQVSHDKAIQLQVHRPDCKKVRHFLFPNPICSYVNAASNIESFLVQRLTGKPTKDDWEQHVTNFLQSRCPFIMHLHSLCLCILEIQPALICSPYKNPPTFALTLAENFTFVTHYYLKCTLLKHVTPPDPLHCKSFSFEIVTARIVQHTVNAGGCSR